MAMLVTSSGAQPGGDHGGDDKDTHGRRSSWNVSPSSPDEHQCLKANNPSQPEFRLSLLNLIHSRVGHWDDWHLVKDPDHLVIHQRNGALTNSVYMVEGPARAVLDGGCSLPLSEPTGTDGVLRELSTRSENVRADRRMHGAVANENAGLEDSSTSEREEVLETRDGEKPSAELPSPRRSSQTDQQLPCLQKARTGMSTHASTSPADTSHAPHRYSSTRKLPRRLLLRIYGQGSEIFVNRSREIQWLQQLSKLQVHPPSLHGTPCAPGSLDKVGVARLLGHFGNGRFEEWLEAETLKVQDIREEKCSVSIARALAQLHKLRLVDRLGRTHVQGHEPVELWSLIDQYMATAEDSLPQIVERLGKQSFPAAFNISRLKQATAALRGRLESIPCPVVFCHNDLQPGNIMRKSNDGLFLVDFEYAAYNYRGYDIGNHFCEWAYDYHRSDGLAHEMDWVRYPAKGERLRFYEAYLEESDQGGSSPLLPPSLSHDGVSADAGKPLRMRLEALDVEVQAFVLASHLIWGLWGMQQLLVSEIEFNYGEYARLRLERFLQDIES